MEAALSSTALITPSKSPRSVHFHLHRHGRLNSFCTNSPLIRSAFSCRILSRRLSSGADGLSKSTIFASASYISAADPRMRCVSSFSSGGDNGEGGGVGGGNGRGGGGGPGDGSDGGVLKIAEAVGAADDVSALSPDVIVLYVGGMSCGGCAGKVKRILESQPQVSSTNVILETETAIVWPVDDAKAVPNWREELGEVLAKHLTSCGFQSNLRGQGNHEGEVPQ